ncbi:polysaccharide export protein [Thalassotalea ponticola]|uniref:polysaccharide export protein n=1 Tax=Thalassotalea ponticola TaxID=1523392 RepID=UPI0025B40D88|nr:polysaccharide export protein [Thalassotalea ponticola]MDN3652643.1 polysaccharide export protein [Thalassotalea ponticola]
MTKLKALTTSLMLLGLTACTIPGGHIEGVSAKDGATNSQSSEELDFDITEQVNTILITPNVLNSIKEREPSATQNQMLEQELQNYAYTVGAGDVLTVTVYDHPELTTPAGQFRDPEQAGNLVDAKGNMFYPYIGRIHVAGKSVEQIRVELTEKLSRYIENPQIDVKVAAYRSKRTYVTGAVSQPMVMPIANIPVTVLDAINQAGGISDDADWRSVILTRDSKEERLDLYALYQKGDMSQNRLLRHNDIVHVPHNDATKVFVMGEVSKAATLPIHRSGLTLAEALGNVGGFNEMTADASGIFVLRASTDANKVADVYQLDASNAAALILATQFHLQPMDLVYVTSAPIARWNKVISLLLPTVRGLDDLNDFENNL